MDAAAVFRVISLIPDRVPRVQSGCLFSAGGQQERVALLERLLHWLAPLDALSVENQQLLGLRSSGGRPAVLEDEGLDDEPLEEEPQAASIEQPGAGTQIAA